MKAICIHVTKRPVIMELWPLDKQGPRVQPAVHS